MKEKPLVSIIMPAYNAGNTIEKSIESVLNQTYLNWELIIVNDGSEDNTWKIMQDFAKKDDRIKVYSNDINLKVAKTRNVALKNSKGKYIAFLDSDDSWTENKLEKHISFMQEKNVDFTYSNVLVQNKNTGKETEWIFDKKVNYKDILKTNQISCLTVVLKKDLIEGLEMLDVGSEDYVFWLSILKERTEYAYNVNKTLAIYSENLESLSRNKFKSAKWQWKVYRNIEKLNLFNSIYYFINYAYNGIKKRI